MRPGTRTGIRLLVRLHSAQAGEVTHYEEDYDNASVSGYGPNPLHEDVNHNSELVVIRYDVQDLPTDLRVMLAGGCDGSPCVPPTTPERGRIVKARGWAASLPSTTSTWCAYPTTYTRCCLPMNKSA